MDARTAIYALLSADAAVGAIVSTRIYPTVVPQDQPMPALVYQRISGVEPGQISADGAALVQSRIQLTALAESFSACAELLDAAREAVLYRHGTIGGVQVVSIVRDIDGVDVFDPEAMVFSQSMDVIVTYIES